uniref:Uncharacterized protein n=1 Tax=Rhizobium leguminosarum bv. trifolii TaxID=386 RepID=A0A1C9HXW1_RHILT|nr:hypothetical protein [Rhizobium leguminosarum bv. trifolii]
MGKDGAHCQGKITDPGRGAATTGFSGGGPVEGMHQ